MKDREKIIRYFAATSDDAKDMAIRLLDLLMLSTVDGHLLSAPSCRLLRRRSGRPSQHI